MRFQARGLGHELDDRIRVPLETPSHGHRFAEGIRRHAGQEFIAESQEGRSQTTGATRPPSGPLVHLRPQVGCRGELSQSFRGDGQEVLPFARTLVGDDRRQLLPQLQFRPLQTLKAPLLCEGELKCFATQTGAHRHQEFDARTHHSSSAASTRACSASSISGSSVKGRVIVTSAARRAGTPSLIRRAAYTSNRVDTPSSRP